MHRRRRNPANFWTCLVSVVAISTNVALAWIFWPVIIDRIQESKRVQRIERSDDDFIRRAEERARQAAAQTEAAREELRRLEEREAERRAVKP